MENNTDQKPYVDYFEKNGYIHVNNMITEDLASTSSNYGIMHSQFAPTVENDEHAQIPNTHGAHGDFLMESIMLHIHPKMEYYTGKKLYPTYSYYRTYKKGDELKVHRDRPACEISCTLTLGFSHPWPIFVGESGPVTMKPGDAVIYKGCEQKHWREPFNGDFAVQVFCHFVDANGPHATEFMDGRGDIYGLANILDVKPEHIVERKIPTQ